MKDFIESVFLMRPDLLEKALEKGPMPSALLEDIGCFWSPVPIYLLTKCWDEFLKADWVDRVADRIEEAKEGNEKIKEFFTSNYGIDFENIEFDFHNLAGTEIWRLLPNETLEDIYVLDRSAILENNRLIDYQLNDAARRWDFKLVEELLEKGANPNVYLYEGRWDDLPEDEDDRMFTLNEHSFHCYDYFYWELASLDGDMQHILFQKIEWTLQEDDRYVQYLVQWYVHKLMYDLLEKYISDDNR